MKNSCLSRHSTVKHFLMQFFNYSVVFEAIIVAILSFKF